MHAHQRRLGIAAVTATVLTAGVLLTAPPAAGYAGGVFFAPPMTQSDPTLPLENASYPRTVQLKYGSPGTILATSEDFYRRPNGFDIRRSTDGGATWTTTPISEVTPGTGTEYPVTWEPTLFEVPQATGTLNAGDVLAAGVAFPPDTTNPPHSIEIYKSTDHGSSWSHLSTPISVPSGAGIWEPDFEIDAAGELVMYYSSEVGFTNGGQSLNHMVSTNGGTSWSASTIDVGSTSSAERPGMPTVTRVGSTWVMNIEGYCNGVTSTRCRPNSRVWVKTSHDGVNWGSATDWGEPVETADGHYLSGTPDTTWSPAGGPHGTLIATGHEVYTESNQTTLAPESGKVIFINNDLGHGPWYELSSPLQWTPTQLGSAGTGCVGWSSGLQSLSADPTQLLMITPVEQQSQQCALRYATGPIGALPYSATFANNQDNGWSTYGGTWSASGGVYTDSAAGSGDKTLVGSTGWSDYTVSADIKLAAGGGNAGVLARVTDPSVGSDAHNGYFVGIAAGGQLFLGRENNAWTALTSVTPTSAVVANSWYTLKVRTVGCQIEARLLDSSSNQIGLLTYQDTGCSTTRLGQAGLRAFQNAASYRNVSVTATPRYEAERANLVSTTTYTGAGSENAYVGGIDTASSSVGFTDVWAPQAGTYALVVRYANGGAASTHNLTVNGSAAGSISYNPTSGWGSFGTTSTLVTLNAGSNTISFTKGTNYAQLDYITLAPRYEAENETVSGGTWYSSSTASNGSYVGGLNASTAAVTFTNVTVPAAGTYTIGVHYANGGAASTHTLTINGTAATPISYAATGGWGVFGYTTTTVTLNAGSNTITLGKGTNYAELDAIDVVTG